MRKSDSDGNEISYGGDRRYFPTSCETYETEFLKYLSLVEYHVFERLTFLAWHREDCLVWAAWPYLEKFIPRLREAAIRRAVKSLAPNLIYPYERKPRGWIHLVNPILIVREVRPRNGHVWFPREKLANYDLALKQFGAPNWDAPNETTLPPLTNHKHLNDTYLRVMKVKTPALN